MSSNLNVLVINGPNLNLLGTREPHLYGDETLEKVLSRLEKFAQQQQIRLRHFQSNAEHELIECIHQAMGKTDFIIINPAAFTHTSVALRDALLAVAIPFIEVHLSNIHCREPFRQYSYFSDKAEGVILGMGTFGYELALRSIAKRLK